jgi:hypothetical protein
MQREPPPAGALSNINDPYIFQNQGFPCTESFLTWRRSWTPQEGRFDYYMKDLGLPEEEAQTSAVKSAWTTSTSIAHLPAPPSRSAAFTLISHFVI